MNKMNNRQMLIEAFDGNKDKVIDYLLIENKRLEDKITINLLDKVDRLCEVIDDYKRRLDSCNKEIELMREQEMTHRFNQANAVMYLEKKVKRQKEALRKLQGGKE